MTPALLDLARRLVACPEFRWAPGIFVPDSDVEGETQCGRVMFVDADGWPRFAGDDYASCPEECGPIDLADPATAGCLLSALVTADPASGWGLSYGPDLGWRATSSAHDIGGETMGEPVARALMLVWGRG